MTHMERFLKSELWKSGDTLTRTEVTQELSIPKSCVQEILHDLADHLGKSEGVQNKIIYRKISGSQEWIKKPWRKLTNEQLGIVA